MFFFFSDVVCVLGDEKLREFGGPCEEKRGVKMVFFFFFFFFFFFINFK